VQRTVDLEFFADTLKDITGHHELVTGINPDARSDLVFLLSWHDLSVGSRYFNSSIQAGFVHSICDGASKAILRANTAVIRSLGTSRHTPDRPAQRSFLVEVEQSELLFQTEPSFFIVPALKRLHGCEKRSK
jgi:hypothetical protein